MKHLLILLLAIALTITLPVLSSLASGTVFFEHLPTAINKQILYQPVTLLIAFAFLAILRIFAPDTFKTFFKKGDIAASVIPVPVIGIKPKPHENWGHTGRDFAIIISLITAVIIYFQVIKGNPVSLSEIFYTLPFSIVFSTTNSFVEEVITRFGIVVALKGIASDNNTAISSAALFGLVHYWGTPGGIPGALAAGFLGWLLTKSILETRGIFWAWLIHFLQDVIILTAIFITP